MPCFEIYYLCKLPLLRSYLLSFHLTFHTWCRFSSHLPPILSLLTIAVVAFLPSTPQTTFELPESWSLLLANLYHYTHY
jgi:hypothetical protein